MIFSKSLKILVYDKCLNILFTNLTRNLNSTKLIGLDAILNKIKMNKNSYNCDISLEHTMKTIPMETLDKLFKKYYTHLEFTYNSHIGRVEEDIIVNLIFRDIFELELARYE